MYIKKEFEPNNWHEKNQRINRDLFNDLSNQFTFNSMNDLQDEAENYQMRIEENFS